MHAFVIGDDDMVTGFRLVGAKGVAVYSLDEAWHALSKAIESVDVTVIIISEELSTKMRDKIDKLRVTRIAPLIVEIPAKLGRSEAMDMHNAVRKGVRNQSTEV